MERSEIRCIWSRITLALHPGYFLPSGAGRAPRLPVAINTTHISQNAPIVARASQAQSPPPAKNNVRRASESPATERQADTANRPIVTPTLPNDVRGGR